MSSPRSRLSRNLTGRSDGLQPGDQAPDALLPGTPGRLFDVFRGPQFTRLVVGAAPPSVPGHRIEPAGPYRPDTQVLVRPDGYVGLIADARDESAIPGYLRSL